jgi:DNA gyrase/topoisomerase IV subunit B
MFAPTFDSQSKQRLINESVDTWIKPVLEDDNTFKTIIKQHKGWIDSIYERCAARTQKKDTADLAKANRKLLRTKVPKLLDANSKDRHKTVLIITEGDCLEENTKIKIFDNINKTFNDQSIKDVEIGNLVLTHTNSLQPIVNIQTKISNGYKITTSSGLSFIASDVHKMLIFDITAQTYNFEMIKNIDKSKHKLVKSILNDVTFFKILSITKSLDKKFNNLIQFANDINDINSMLISDKSSCAVYDSLQEKIVMKKVSNINIYKDLLIGS